MQSQTSDDDYNDISFTYIPSPTKYYYPVHFSGLCISLQQNYKQYITSIWWNGYSWCNGAMVDILCTHHFHNLFPGERIIKVDIMYTGLEKDDDRCDAIIYTDKRTIVIEVKQRYDDNEYPFTNLGEEEKRQAIIASGITYSATPMILFIEKTGKSYLYDLSKECTKDGGIKNLNKGKGNENKANYETVIYLKKNAIYFSMHNYVEFMKAFEKSKLFCNNANANYKRNK